MERRIVRHDSLYDSFIQHLTHDSSIRHITHDSFIRDMTHYMTHSFTRHMSHLYVTRLRERLRGQMRETHNCHVQIKFNFFCAVWIAISVPSLVFVSMFLTLFHPYYPTYLCLLFLECLLMLHRGFLTAAAQHDPHKPYIQSKTLWFLHPVPLLPHSCCERPPSPPLPPCCLCCTPANWRGTADISRRMMRRHSMRLCTPSITRLIWYWFYCIPRFYDY